MMKANLFPLQNRGMSRDTSASKADNALAWENHNIRVTPRDHDTLLSVTNERGTKEIALPEGMIKGTLIGWNVLNNHIILFTTENDKGGGSGNLDNSALLVVPRELTFYQDGGMQTINITVSGDDTWELTDAQADGDSSEVDTSTPDHIYRIDYDGTSFRMVCGDTDDDGVDKYSPEYGVALYDGNLGFSKFAPIESIVYYEAANIQKIYWLDGLHVLRFLNIMETNENRKSWDNTFFDSNRAAKSGLDVGITKSNGGNNRANGVAQYLVTYYNKHGQETGYVWVSDLVYLSPTDTGGSPDGTNSNTVRLDIEGLDNSFSNYKVYSIFRSSLDGEAVAYVIADNLVPEDGNAIIIDDGAPLMTADVTSLLYLGGRDVVAGTMTAKDNTLFLGDITHAGIGGYDELEDAIHRNMFVDGETFTYGTTWRASCVTFEYSDGTQGKENIELEPIGGFYPYKSQLNLTSSQIQSFKGGERYRFALVFRTPNGVSSKAFWIGDLDNSLYPVMVSGTESTMVRRPIAKCTIPAIVVDKAISAGYVTATLMIAKADASDRRVLAQGIVNPTMFNVWDRYKNRLYAYSSWITRPRHSAFASSHFAPVAKSTTRVGEIQCNWWESDTERPTPYYRQYTTGGTNARGDTVVTGNLDDILSGEGYTHYKLIYYIRRGGAFRRRQCCGGWILIRAKCMNGSAVSDATSSNLELISHMKLDSQDSYTVTYKENTLGVTTQTEIIQHMTSSFSLYWNFWKNEIYDKLTGYLDVDKIVAAQVFEKIFFDTVVTQGDNTKINVHQLFYFTGGGVGYDNKVQTIFGDERNYEYWLQRILTEDVANRITWYSISDAIDMNSRSNKYRSSYYKKNLFFVDENIVTLNSPEFEQEQVIADKTDLRFRIVGIAKIVGNTTDYVVEATESKKAGENVIQDSFSRVMPASNPDGLINGPLFAEYGLVPLSTIPEHSDDKELLVPAVDSADYNWGTGSVWYWLYMWHKSGGIPGVKAGDGFRVDNNGDDDSDEENNTQVENVVEVDETLYSELESKTFANLRFAYSTVYTNTPAIYGSDATKKIDVRQYTYTDGQYTSLKVAGTQRSYNANVRQGINMPSGVKYPVCYTEAGDVDSSNPKWYLGSNDQVMLAYKSSPHAVISLGAVVANNNVQYDILPQIMLSGVSYMDAYTAPTVGPSGTAMLSAGLLPWTGSEDSDYNTNTFTVSQPILQLPEGSVGSADKYVFIGELYKYNADETLYNGKSKAAVESNIFVIAGPQQTLLSGQDMELIGNQGDTYFQRWDCLKTKPYGDTETNSVTDITSVMVETHVNIDGRYDNMRTQKLLASMDTTDFGHVNPVYSQTNDFFAANDYGDEHTVDAYRSTITWTKEKAPSADIDAWSHITLASTQNLDGDKGVCRALRRFQNSILAFQDRGIAEVLFNSRTQIATTEGVPIEIANSGKVDGKRYISNKYGCINKWSIAEGKNGLYFIDNTNKMIGVFNGESIGSLTSASYLDIWMREHNSLDIWTPALNSNFVSYYDRIHSDVYFVGNDIDNPTIVYNEVLGTFTGFFDYKDVPMMTNVGDRFVSFHTSPAGYNALWLQNEGLYNSFYGITKPFYMIWRAQPDPYGDKIWGSLEYRADFFRVLDGLGDVRIGEESPTGGQKLDNGLVEGDYQPDMTFSHVEIWNEYQTTGRIRMSWDGADSAESYPDIRKKFRIWRADIPRAMKNETNKYGLDRIRNPWIWLRIGMDYDKLDNMCMMQLHDINIKYYTNG